MTQKISTVITDLDNTLFDWVAIWHHSFMAMLDRLVQDSGIAQEVLETEFKQVFGRCCQCGIRTWKRPSLTEGSVKHPIEPENNPTVAHEHTDADARAITQFGIALTFLIIVSQLVLWWVFSSFSQREQKLSPPVPAIVKAQAPREPPEPRLQANPQSDLRKMLQEEDEILNHYGWVDPDRGIVRLPIERALDIVAQKGLPQFKATAETPVGKAKPKISK